MSRIKCHCIFYKENLQWQTDSYSPFVFNCLLCNILNLILQCVATRQLLCSSPLHQKHLPVVSPSVLRCIVSSLVLSRLDYGCATLAGLPRQLLDRLQSGSPARVAHPVLNAAARLIFASRRYNHVTPHVHSLHWLWVPERITFRLAVLAYRCLHGSAPAYLASELFPVSRASRQQRLRSSSTTDLVIPRVNHNTLGSRASAASATSAWNSISHGARTSPSLTTFSSRLKTEMFQRSYA